jgi:hypothetical protein
MKLEGDFKTDTLKELKREFPGCLILKNDESYQQGIPDVVIFWGRHYAFLEFKRKEPTSAKDWRPNQEWFLEQINEMGFASVIYPANKREVIDALHTALSPC